MIIVFIHNLLKVIVPSVGLHVHFQPFLLKLIKIGYQIVIRHLNQGIHVLKIVNIKNTGKLQLLAHHEILRRKDAPSLI